MAEAAGYRESHFIDQEKRLDKVFKRTLSGLGPIFIQVKVSKEVSQSSPRLPSSAQEIKE
jgi:thiamine pyrophosphate-dependent acetolactate synthase large subunit-like protein